MVYDFKPMTMQQKQGTRLNIAINKNITIQGNRPTDTVITDARRKSRIFSGLENLNLPFINIIFIN